MLSGLLKEDFPGLQIQQFEQTDALCCRPHEPVNEAWHDLKPKSLKHFDQALVATALETDQS